MKEIEVKARIKDIQTVIKHLEQLGCVISQPIKQIDRIFIPREANIPVAKGVNVLRIREQAGKYLFTLKQPVDNQLDCIEKELEITDANIMIEIIKLLGFIESGSVEKVRRKCKFNDYEICVDEVKDLGSFIEVEKFSDQAAEIVQKELFDFLQRLGIKPEDQEFMGYDVLLFKQQHVSVIEK